MKLLFTLEEVAEATGFLLGPLESDCRAGRVEHVHRSRQRYMTLDQILALIARHTVKADPKAGRPTALPADEIEAARERVGARLTRSKRQVPRSPNG